MNTAALRTEVDILLRADHDEIIRKLDEVLLRMDQLRGLAAAFCESQVALPVRAERRLSADAELLLVRASESADGNVSKLNSSSYGEVINIHTQVQEFLGKPSDSRARARWLHAFDELVQAGHLEQTTHYGIFRVSHTGYQLADVLKQGMRR